MNILSFRCADHVSKDKNKERQLAKSQISTSQNLQHEGMRGPQEHLSFPRLAMDMAARLSLTASFLLAGAAARRSLMHINARDAETRESRF